MGQTMMRQRGKKKKQRKKDNFFHAMSRISRGNPGRASAVSRFPRFPDRDHQPWEDPHGPRTAEAPPPNDQNDEALLKKILPGAVTVPGGDVLVRCQNHSSGSLGLESSRLWVVMTPRGHISASSVERQTGTDWHRLG